MWYSVSGLRDVSRRERCAEGRAIRDRRGQCADWLSVPDRGGRATCRSRMTTLRNGAAAGVIAALMFLLPACSTDHETVWVEAEGHRWADVSPGSRGGPGFDQHSASRTGIRFTNHLRPESIAENRNLLNGSGVATGDVDGDGLIDVYFAQLDGPNRLYRNLGGWQFEDVTNEAGVAHEGYRSTGVVFADIDGDGDLDLLVAAMTGRNAFYVNDGSGKFTLQERSGLGDARGSSTMALADIDGDQDLDLYVANYKEKSVKDLFDLMEITWENTVVRVRGAYELRPPFDEHFVLLPNGAVPDRREIGTRDDLYINNGDGTFERAVDLERRFMGADGEEQGLDRDWGLTAIFQDLNADGHPDLYVCNDFWTPDRIWLNRGDGTFRAIEEEAIRTLSFSSMAIDFSDIDRDGLKDFFVSEMLSRSHETRLRQVVTYSPFIRQSGNQDVRPQYMRNTLYLNRGDATFAEIAQYSGVSMTGWSWATRFLDVDLDGYEDLLVNTGHPYDVLDLDTQERLSQRMLQRGEAGKGYILEYPSLELTNVAYRNNGDLTFSDRSSDWGFHEADVSHGLATADFDNDGDLDLAVNRLNAPAAIFENTTTAPRIAVRLRGHGPNPQAVGAKLVLTGGPATQSKEVIAGGAYVSGSDPLVSFAADNHSDHVLKVTWPDGTRTVLEGLRANRIYEIDQSMRVSIADTSGNTQTKNVESASTSIFEDVSDRIDHVHRESDFNDFALQRLLPVRLSEPGPGVAWIDVGHDGDDDLVIGSGKGGTMAVLENVDAAHFESMRAGALKRTAETDQTGIAAWETADGIRIAVGQSSFEGAREEAAAIVYTLRADGRVDAVDIPGTGASTSGVTAADYDRDGDLDLFVGGRVVPGSYPMDADSRLIKNENGDFQTDDRNDASFRGLGMVTDALFFDYDGDGDPDLLCSLAWGSIRLFRNDDGIFVDVTKDVGLHRHVGWWNGLATGDFNNDGRSDFVATNLGLNSVYQIRNQEPLKLFYDDFDGDARPDPLETYHDAGAGGYVPRRGLYELHRAIPSITRYVSSHREFAASSLADILGRNVDEIPSKMINTLAHMVFISNEGTFHGTELPAEAQFSAGFYAGVADFDNDGNEDIFISQNLFAVRPLTPRLDAGRGLWMRGNGRGEFSSVPGTESGIKLYGEQRGAALGDFNGDARVDLAVSQNDGETALYANRAPRSGIRVRLRGPDDNRNGIGARLRVVYRDGSKGPLREVQTGSGYLSQNSTTQVLGLASEPDGIEVAWPDGVMQFMRVKEGAVNVELSHPTLQSD